MLEYTITLGGRMTRTNEEIIESINETLITYIAPIVSEHYGFVKFVSYENGHVLLELIVPADSAVSTDTLNSSVEEILREMVPEVISIEGLDDPVISEPFGIHPHDLNDEEELSDDTNNE
jgi:Fe-S cluster biogenesis protein NfuA